MVNWEWVWEGLWGNYATCHLPSYLVNACRLVYWLLPVMLLILEAPSQFSTNQGYYIFLLTFLAVILLINNILLDLKYYVFSFLNFRTSPSEFVLHVNKYLEGRNHNFSIGLRFRMRFEGDESPERRYLKWLLLLSFWQNLLHVLMFLRFYLLGLLELLLL